MEINNIAPLISQMILTKAGLYCSERLSNDIYFLNECIDLLLPTFDLKSVEKEFNDKFGKGSWSKTMKNRKKVIKKLSEAKTFYDAIINKSITSRVVTSQNSMEEAVQKYFKKFFFKTSSKINLLQPDIYNLWVFLVYNSQMQHKQIKNEYFRNLEQRDNRKIALDKRETAPVTGG